MTSQKAIEQSVRALVDSQRLAKVSDKQLASARMLRVALARLSEAWGDVARELKALEEANV